MKILILGDSFADPKWATNDYMAWPELLANDYKITNLALQGSSLWWSYQNYLKHSANYDYCIFVVTVPTRIHLESLDRHMNPSTTTIQYGVNLEEIYYSYFYSESRESFFQMSIVDKLLKEDNILLVPAFLESIHSYKDWTLCHFSDSESDYYNQTRPVKNDLKRKCHLTKESNDVVYQKVLESIKNKDKILKLTQNDFVTPSAPKKYYWS